MKTEDQKTNNFGTSLIESVAVPNLTDMAEEAAELALDSLLNDGLLKDVPVFGWLFKGYGAYRNITERIFLKKLGTFLYGVSEASQSQREKFRQAMIGDPLNKKQFGERLLLLIDRHERVEKSFLLGQLMAKVIEGELSKELFQRLAAAIDRITVEDLEELKLHQGNIVALGEHVKQGLYRAGLVDLDLSGYQFSEFVDVSVDYKINGLGKALLEHGFA